MNKDKIFVDGAEQATLRYGSTAIDCLNLQEAVLEWMRLPEDSKGQATIRVKSGAVYDVAQIDRLHSASQNPVASTKKRGNHD
jgi:hypothetical protein